MVHPGGLLLLPLISIHDQGHLKLVCATPLSDLHSFSSWRNIEFTGRNEWVAWGVMVPVWAFQEILCKEDVLCLIPKGLPVSKTGLA